MALLVSRGFRDDDEERAVLIRFDEIENETDDAFLIGDEVWLPKSAVLSLDEENGEVWIPISLAKEKGLDYE